MKRLLLVAALFALGPALRAAPGDGGQTTDPTAQQTYDQQVRDAEAARRQYEAAQAQYQRDLARNQAEVRRAQEAQADYDRRMARRHPRGGRNSASAPAAAPVSDARDTRTQVAAGEPAAAPSEQCQQQQRRGRRRGRAIGGVLGGVAGGVLGTGSTLQRLATVAL